MQPVTTVSITSLNITPLNITSRQVPSAAARNAQAQRNPQRLVGCKSKQSLSQAVPKEKSIIPISGDNRIADRRVNAVRQTRSFIGKIIQSPRCS